MIFVIFKMAATAILDLKKLQILMVSLLNGPDVHQPTNPRWQTAAILKTVKSPYLCNHLTECD